MEILILGSTGRTGKLVLEEALRKGHHVHALVRDKMKIFLTDNNLSVIEGSSLQPANLERAMNGCQAIISILNISRTSDWPWARLRSPETFMSDAMDYIIRVATAHGVARIVICSASGVGETRSEIPGWFRWLIDHSNIGITYKDHERQENLLMQSGMNWTIVRPTVLTNSEKRQRVVESYRNQPKQRFMISRRSVAHYMVEALEREDLIGKAPTISAS